MINKKTIFSVTPLTIGISLAINTVFAHSEPLYQTSLKLNEPTANVNNAIARNNNLNSTDRMQQWVESLGFQKDQFQLQKIKKSLTATHYYYQQYEQGFPVENSTVSISLSTDNGSVNKQHAHVINKKMSIQSKLAKNFQQSHNDALNIAWNNIRVTGKLRVSPDVTQVWLPTDKGLIASYRVKLLVSAPFGDWLQYIDATTGKVLKLEQTAVFERGTLQQREYKYNFFWNTNESKVKPFDEALSEFNAFQQLRAINDQEEILVSGTGRVFDPDPKTTLSDDTLTDTSAEELFDAAYFTYTLPEVTKKGDVYHLKSPWIEMHDFDTPEGAPATSTDGNWSFKRGQNGFDDTNVFYHIDANQRYIQSLGYKEETGIQYGPIKTDANGWDGQTNASFSPDLNAMSFGHGGVNTSEDADVILHEYGHAINFNINENWGGPDAGAISEGFGDYWAGSYSLTTTNGDSFFPNRLATWAGHNEFFPGRILNDIEAKYNPDYFYPAHTEVNGVLSDQLWSTPLFQSLLQLIEMGVPREEVDTIMLEAQFGLGGGLTMPIVAQSIVDAASKLYPNGPHKVVLLQNFVKHNILKGAVEAESISVHSGHDNIIDPGEVVFIKIPLKAGVSSVKKVFGYITAPDSMYPLWTISPYNNMEPLETSKNIISYTLKVPHTMECGTKFDIDFSYQGLANEVKFSGEKTFNMIVGNVKEDFALHSEVYDIPDNSPEIVTTLTLDEPDTLIEDLKVSVNIEHTYTGDLLVTIESPLGTRVPLHTRMGHDIDNLIVTYPIDAAPAKPLSQLNGEPLSGQWKLIVQDLGDQDVGKVVEWGLIYKKKAKCKK